MRKSHKNALGAAALLVVMSAACSRGMVNYPDGAGPVTSPPTSASNPPSSSIPTSGPSPGDLDTSCSLPEDNYWRADVTELDVHPRSDAWMQSIGVDENLHPDFGAGSWEGVPIGIPYNVVPADQPTVQIDWTWYADDDMADDDEPWPMPLEPAIEGGVVAQDREPDSDAHVLIVQEGTCRLYETWYTHRMGDRWVSPAGAVFDLTSNDLPPDGPTSADAAGLPIFVGLARADEAVAGHIGHALRFTASRTQAAHVWPARHDASEITDADVPPMGIRLRLKATVDPTRFTGQARVVVEALQTYGMVLADNGSSLFVSGSNDPRWNDPEIETLKQLSGSDFEVVDTSVLMVDPDSARVR